MAVREPETIYVVCPYCDAENTVATISRNGDKADSPSREITCDSCCSLFRLSEGRRRSYPSLEE